MPSPATPPPVEQSWERLTAWLRANAPASFETLRPGASQAEIAAAQSELSVSLPTDVTTILMMNDGCPEWDPDPQVQFACRWLPTMNQLLPVAAIPQRTGMLNEILTDQLDEAMSGFWWHPEWILFAADIAGDGLAVDQRAGGEQGAVGFFFHDGTTEFGLASSLAAFFAELTDCLEQQHDFKYFRPVIEEARLAWEVVLAN